MSSSRRVVEAISASGIETTTEPGRDPSGVATARYASSLPAATLNGSPPRPATSAAVSPSMTGSRSGSRPAASTTRAVTRPVSSTIWMTKSVGASWAEPPALGGNGPPASRMRSTICGAALISCSSMRCTR